MGQLQLIKQKLENSLNRDKRTFPSRDQVQRAALAEEVSNIQSRFHDILIQLVCAPAGFIKTIKSKAWLLCISYFAKILRTFQSFMQLRLLYEHLE